MASIKSPAYKLMECFCQCSKRLKGHNHFGRVLRDAILVCIEGGLRFDEDDFKTMKKSNLRGFSYLDFDESLYLVACESGNTSACKALEKWINRPPFIDKGKRLYVGAEFTPPGEPEKVKAKVTSFDKHGEYLVCCTYQWEEGSNGQYGKHVLGRKIKVTLEELRTQQRIRKPTPPLGLRRFVQAHADYWGYYKETAKREFLRCGNIVDAWEKEFGQGLDSFLIGLALIGCQIPYATVKSWKSLEEAKAAVNFEKDILPLLKPYTEKHWRNPHAKKKETASANAE